MFHSFLFDDAEFEFKTAANMVAVLDIIQFLQLTGAGHLTLYLSAACSDAESSLRGNDMETVLDERCSYSVGDATPGLPTYASSTGQSSRRARRKPCEADSLNSCNADPSGLSAIREWCLVCD
jgi:hypothetical protein